MGPGTARPLTLPPGGVARLARAAADAAPRETCGVLVGAGDRVDAVVGVPNVAARRDRFELDPEGLFAAIVAAESSGLEVLGTFHSHPRAAAVPSPVDLETWVPGWVSVVVDGDGRARAWELVAGAPRERPILERSA